MLEWFCSKGFLKNALVMNDGRAANCKHTRSVMRRRIATSFVFSQGHTARAGPGVNWARWVQKDAVALNGESFVVVFYSSLLITRLDFRSSATFCKAKAQGCASANEQKCVCLKKSCLSVKQMKYSYMITNSSCVLLLTLVWTCTHLMKKHCDELKCVYVCW